jgi:hypothetical protein
MGFYGPKRSPTSYDLDQWPDPDRVLVLLLCGMLQVLFVLCRGSCVLLHLHGWSGGRSVVENSRAEARERPRPVQFAY